MAAAAASEAAPILVAATGRYAGKLWCIIVTSRRAVAISVIIHDLDVQASRRLWLFGNGESSSRQSKPACFRNCTNRLVIRLCRRML